MTLSAFEDAAREHLANPPATWTVHRVAARTWQVRTRDGAIVDRCASKAAAVQSRQDGTHVRLWQERTDWYLGRSTNPRDRPLTADERAVIDEILHPADTAPGHVRAVRFCDRDNDDHQVWIATRTPEGRWAVDSLRGHSLQPSWNSSTPTTQRPTLCCSTNSWRRASAGSESLPMSWLAPPPLRTRPSR